MTGSADRQVAEEVSRWVSSSQLGSPSRKCVMLVIAHGCTDAPVAPDIPVPAGYAVSRDSADQIAKWAELTLSITQAALASMEMAGVIHRSTYFPGTTWVHYRRPLASIGRDDFRVGRPSRAAIPPDVRALVYARDGYACAQCGATSALTLDHVMPWSLGGSDDQSNLRTLCRSCNSRKGVTVLRSDDREEHHG